MRTLSCTHAPYYDRHSGNVISALITNCSMYFKNIHRKTKAKIMHWFRQCLCRICACAIFKNWMLILVLLWEHERQRWDASRYIKAHSEAKRFYVYRDASYLWSSCSHNRTKINIQPTDIAILVHCTSMSLKCLNCPRKMRIIFPLAELSQSY